MHLDDYLSLFPGSTREKARFMSLAGAVLQQVMDLIAGQQYRQDLKRHRDLRIYRGENNSAFTLSTSLTRNCKSLSKVLEKPMLENFTKYAVLEEPIIEGNVWKQMMPKIVTKRCFKIVSPILIMCMRDTNRHIFFRSDF